jgi:hypothetical protein
MPNSSIPHVDQLLHVLREVVPGLKFCARLLLSSTKDAGMIYIFGVYPSGEVVGGYELRYCPATPTATTGGVARQHRSPFRPQSRPHCLSVRQRREDYSEKAEAEAVK